MARVKPTEVRLVSGLLAEPADDADALAERIISALDSKRMSDDQWIVVYQWAPREHYVTIAHGPFGTAGQAERAIKKLVSPGEPLARAMVVKIRDLPP